MNVSPLSLTRSLQKHKLILVVSAGAIGIAIIFAVVIAETRNRYQGHQLQFLKVLLLRSCHFPYELENLVGSVESLFPNTGAHGVEF